MDQRQISPEHFFPLLATNSIEQVPKKRLEQLFQTLAAQESSESLNYLVRFLDLLQFDESLPVDSDFVFPVRSGTGPRDDRANEIGEYLWRRVCQKLICWDEGKKLPLLDLLLTRMGEDYRLSYNSTLESMARELVQMDPSGTWRVIRTHFEKSFPNWRFDIINWLNGGLRGFDEGRLKGAIADLPIGEILQWVDEDPKSRAQFLAHAAPKTLDDISGTNLTRELLRKYGHLDGVRQAISANFHTGGWTGPTSAYLKRKRQKLREWLSAGFDFEIIQWIELELEYMDRSIEREEINEERTQFD